MWNLILLALVMHGKCLTIERLSVGKCSMHIEISGWHSDDFGLFNSVIDTYWCRCAWWRSRREWCQFWWWCIFVFTPLICLWILCSTILGRIVTANQIFKNHSWVSFYRSLHLHIGLATGLGNPPAVRVQTAKTVRFCSKPLQQPNPLYLGGPTPDPYPSTPRWCQDWLDPSVPISGSGFEVFVFMVTFAYLIAYRKILTFAYRCSFLMYWPPWQSKTYEKCSLPHPEHVESTASQWFLVMHLG